MTETKKELLEVFAMAISALGILFVFAFACGNYYQKDTCKHIIQSSSAVLINRNEISLETPVTKNWQKLNPNEQLRLLQFAKERERDYNECEDYPYLINGKEYDGSDLYFSVRRNEYDMLEVKLDH